MPGKESLEKETTKSEMKRRNYLPQADESAFVFLPVCYFFLSDFKSIKF